MSFNVTVDIGWLLIFYFDCLLSFVSDLFLFSVIFIFKNITLQLQQVHGLDLPMWKGDMTINGVDKQSGVELMKIQNGKYLRSTLTAAVKMCHCWKSHNWSKCLCGAYAMMLFWLHNERIQVDWSWRGRSRTNSWSLSLSMSLFTFCDLPSSSADLDLS